MKRTLTLIIAVLLMSGCTKDEKGTSNQGIYREMSQKVNDLPEEFAFPDGTVVPKEDIDIRFSNPVTPYLDFAFIRYAEPIFISTLDCPDIVDFEKLEIREESRYEYEPQWIKVRAGDVLENGLRMASAYTPCASYKDDDGKTSMDFSFGNVRLEGEITLEGLLTYHSGSEYSLSFFPDATKSRIPLVYSSYPDDTRANAHFLDRDCTNALVYDGGYFYYHRFESEYSRNVGDFKKMFTEDTLCRAKVTFKDIVLCANNILDGEIISIETET